MKQKLLLAKISRALAKQPIRLAYLYGSYATGKTNSESDIDIAVVLEPNANKTDFEIAADLHREVTKNGLPKIDVRAITLDSNSVFLANVLKPAQPILVKNEQERIYFETKALQKFYDTKHLRDIDYYYLTKRVKEGVYGSGIPNYHKTA